MLRAWNQTCKDCAGNADPKKDTVKVNMEQLAARGKENSENVPPHDAKAAEEQEQRRKEEEMRRKREEMVARKREEEAERRRQEEEAERLRLWEEQQLEQQRLIEEQERRAAIEAARRRAAEEKRRAELERQHQEEQKRQEAARQAEEARLHHEEQQRLAVEQRRREQQEAAAAQLKTVLNSLGFSKVNEKLVKKGLVSSSFSYPLHAAAEKGDVEAVRLLIWGGAKPSLINSKKQTPLQLAQKKNKKGSHDGVISILTQP